MSACESGKSEPNPAGSRSRFEAVEAEADPRFAPDQFCENWQADGGPAFSLPPLAGAAGAGSGAGPGAGSARWVNVWATWCKPCIEEFPRIADWTAKLAGAGHRTELVFISVDGADVNLEEFAKLHPEVADTLQISDPEQLSGWLEGLGLPANAVLPIHLFVDAAGRLRCVRMGGVGAEDFPGVEQVLGSI
ncbi:Thioredoxin [Enhygromyxa salina]|uniref:Thioredoxin n=1 Tax=Enhygromyxa salina TaxID=215803 RepID=A0A0C2CV25_9BACT|nr:Thioredoxin [Enhygromyxa salina]